MKTLLRMVALAMLLGSPVLLVSCEKSEPETVGEAIEDVGDAVGDAVEQVGDEIKDATN